MPPASESVAEEVAEFAIDVVKQPGVLVTVACVRQCTDAKLRAGGDEVPSWRRVQFAGAVHDMKLDMVGVQEARSRCDWAGQVGGCLML